MPFRRCLPPLIPLLAILLSSAGAAWAQAPMTWDGILGYPFAYELVAAKKADRVAWLQFEKGRRNVYIAAAPDFKPVALTRFTADDGTDLTGLALSDDGSVAVFVRGHAPNRDGWVANPSQAPDGSEQAIWAVRTSEGRPFWLAAGSAPVLSPGGRMALFVRDGQIHGVLIPPAGSPPPAVKAGDPEPLFRTWGANSRPVWSPDGRKIAFVSDRKDHSFIGVYEPSTRKIVYMAPSVDRDTSPSWSPDSKRIAFIRRPGQSFGQITSAAASSAPGQGRPTVPPPASPPPASIASGPGFQAAKFADGRVLTFWTADASTGEAECAWREPLDDPSFQSLNAIVWAGSSLVFRVERNDWAHYYSVPAAGGLDAVPVDLTPGDGEAEFVGLAPDGRTLFYSTNVGDVDRRDLWAAPTAGGEPKRLTSGEGIETSPAPLASGRSIAVLYTDVRRPQTPALVPREGGEARVIGTPPAPDFPAAAHVVPEPVLLKAEDGLEFHNQLFLPKDIQPGERRPALLFTHGGPGRQMLLGYHYMFFYHMAYAVNQYFADRGYVVISVNYRSGIGYGQKFRQAPNRGAAGSSEYQDIVAAARYLQSRQDVDPERIGLWGLSYGGLLTALGLSRNSDIFKVGVDIAGVHLWGNSLDQELVSFKASSIATVDRWTSPVLLVHGDDDRNVAFSQTTGLVQLLRARNVPHELIVFPDEVHDFLVHAKWMRVFRAAEEFLAKHLKRA